MDDRRRTKTDKRLERPRTGLKPVILNDFPQDLWLKARIKGLRENITMRGLVITLIDRWLKGRIRI